MRTSFTALLLAAAFVTTVGGAKAADASIENAGNQAIVFAAKTSSGPVQSVGNAPVFTADLNRDIHVNPAAMNSGR